MARRGNRRGSWLGVDVGLRADHSAWALTVRDAPRPEHEGSPAWATVDMARLPIGTPFAELAAEVVEVATWARKRFGGSCLVVVDETGQGDRAVDLIRDALRGVSRVDYRGVCITGGRKAHVETPERVTVPKANLVAALDVELQQNRLRLPGPEHEFSGVLVDELDNYVTGRTTAGNQTWGARSDAIHDDLTTALQLAVWGATESVGRFRPAELVNPAGLLTDETGTRPRPTKATPELYGHNLIRAQHPGHARVRRYGNAFREW